MKKTSAKIGKLMDRIYGKLENNKILLSTTEIIYLEDIYTILGQCYNQLLVLEEKNEPPSK